MEKQIKPRVFVVTSKQNSESELRPAEVFGRISKIFDRESGHPLGSPFEPSKICAKVRERLKAEHYDPRVDYVAVYGSFVYAFCLAATLAVDYGKVKLLIFDAANNRYVEREVDLRGL